MTLVDVQSKIKEYCTASHREAFDVKLIAVSKTKSPVHIEEAFHQGQKNFGENYLEELTIKVPALSHCKGIRWIYIGQLQSNKIQKIVSLADEIQTIASIKHARYVNRYADEMEKKDYPVWIHVNAENETKKFGASPEEVPTLAKFILEECKSLRLEGIMSIPPAIYSDASFPSQSPELYHQLVLLAKQTGLGKISLGMSNDLRIAISAGSNCVRIGTAIFGERTYQ